MRKIRIHQPGPLALDSTIELTESAGLHIGTVLRLQPGEQITLFCGDNQEFSATIVSVHKKKVIVTLTSAAYSNRESPRALHLAQVLSKGDRMEWIIQKAVEIGVTSITPLFSAHCVVRLNKERLAKKHAQWLAIAIGACEQSGRNQLPIIHPACNIEDYLHDCNAHLRFVLSPSAQGSWRDYELISGSIALLVGPEGGLSEGEVKDAVDKGFNPLSLGPRILRTETAAIAALSVLQAVCGDW